MRFRLHLSLDDDGMKTPRDIAATLHKIADELDETYAGMRPSTTGEPGVLYNDDITEQDALTVLIRDENGNTVGHWKIEEEPKTEGTMVEDADAPVLGNCEHGVDLDRHFCPEGCRV